MAKQWNFKQELISNFGKPIAENPTQYMIERAFQHHGLDWRYINFEIDAEGLSDAVRGMRVMGFRGGNCTIPNKVAVIPYLDRLGESAALMGAVNCIVRHGDELVGENTDGKGFVQSLNEANIDPHSKRVVLLGAGGAARAIAVEMALAGTASFTIVNRTPQRGNDLVTLIEEKTPAHAELVTWDGDFQVPSDTDIVVNATSIGLFPDVEARVPLDLDSITSNTIIADVIPNPPRTRLVREAEQKGCTVLDGLGMLVNQGFIGFRNWTGVDPDPSVMRQALEEVFGE